jgi:hypothetical protein
MNMFEIAEQIRALSGLGAIPPDKYSQNEKEKLLEFMKGLIHQLDLDDSFHLLFKK